jgi:hypothetical protein
LKVSSLPPGAAQSIETQDTPGTPDPVAVEWLRAAMSAATVPPGPDGDTVSPLAAGAGNGQAAAGNTLGNRILAPFRKGAASLSQTWQQTEQRASALQQRTELDGAYMKDLFDVQRNWSLAYFNLDILSKAAGKAAYTVDSLSRN